ARCGERGRGAQDRNRWSRARGIQRICQQVVVEETLIPTEAALEVVPFVLIGAKTRVVVGIASPPHAVEVEIVEQQALVIDRLHRKRLVKNSRASLQIYQCVVHVAAAAHVGTPVAQFDGLVNLVPAAGYAIGFGGRGWGRGRIRGWSLGE